MTTIEFLNSPLARALGWTLLHAVWQGFVLVLPTAVALHLLRRRSSLFRYRLGTVTLFAQLLLSGITLARCYQPTAVVRPITTAAMALPIHWPTTGQPLPWPQQVLLFLETHLSDFVCIYLIGVLVFGLRLAGGWLHLHQLRRSAVAAPLLAERALVERLRTTLNIRAVVQVRESARVAGPMIIGVLKPLLLLPAGLATGLSTRELEAVLAHELAHVRRYDYAVNLMQSVVEMLYFFHPALWWLSARVREEREHCCDDMAVHVCGDNGRALAQALARIEERRLEQAIVPALAMAFAGRRQLLLHRVQRVLGLSTRSLVSNRSLAGLTLATMLLISASVYAIQRQEKPQQPKPKAATPVRRSSSATELHFDDNRKLTYVMWKGQTLPASRVADLQKKWEQVMTGRVNLDAIPQPDRDILLNVIESQYGKISSLEQDKYVDMAEASLQTVPFSPDGATTNQLYTTDVADSIPLDNHLTKVEDNYAKTTVTDTSRLQKAQRQIEQLSREMSRIIADRQPIIDRMSGEMAELASKNSAIQKKTQVLQERQAKLASQQTVLASKQTALGQKVLAVQAEISRLSTQRTAKAKELLKQKTQQREQFQKQMDELGSQMGVLGGRMGDLGSQLGAVSDPYRQRIIALADSVRKLYEPTYALSEKIAELSSQLAEDANKQAEKAMEMANKVMELNVDIPINVAVPVSVRRPLSKSRKDRIIQNKATIPTPPPPPAMAAPAQPARPATPPRTIKGRATISDPSAPPKE